MLDELIVKILKKIYKKLLIKVMVLNKKSYNFYEKLNPFCTLKIDTNQGSFIFLFKEDRRKGYKKQSVVKHYIVELIPPEELAYSRNKLNEKVVLVVKFLFFTPNYNALTQVLADTYIESMLLEGQDY